MAKVTIYTKMLCPFCDRAIALLERKGAEVTEIKAGFNRTLTEEMVARSGRRTYPQIFIDDQHVGGCDDLYALEAQGRLDPLLKAV
ncbi:MAG: glutaredoxin 3 [Hyphomonadaceae bacterium]|nr:glutaredoxin 3 [Hyphomonadaceae bacterium]